MTAYACVQYLCACIQLPSYPAIASVTCIRRVFVHVHAYATETKRNEAAYALVRIMSFGCMQRHNALL